MLVRLALSAFAVLVAAGAALIYLPAGVITLGLFGIGLTVLFAFEV